MKQTFGRRDCLFLAALFALGIVLTVGIYCFSENGSAITVTVDGQLYGTYTLSEAREIPIELDGGISNVIVIEALHHAQQGDIGLGHRLKQPVFLEKIGILRVAYEGEMGMQDDAEIAL